MRNLMVAVALSVVSAVGYALAAVAQQRVAGTPRQAGDRTWVVRLPMWWLAVGLNVAAAGLHVVALRYGSLAVVQPLGALTVAFALPAAALFTGARVSAREWRGAAATVTGLGLLLMALGASASAQLGNGDVCAVGAVGALTVAVLLGGGDTSAARGLRLAAASGVVFAVASTLSQAAVLRWASPTDDPVVTAIVAGGAAALSAAGLMLSQSAYRFGLGPQLATVTIVNPVFSVGVAVVIYGLALSPEAAALAVVAAVLTARGMVLLTTSSRPADTAPAASVGAVEADSAARPQALGRRVRQLADRRMDQLLRTSSLQQHVAIPEDRPVARTPDAGHPLRGSARRLHSEAV